LRGKKSVGFAWRWIAKLCCPTAHMLCVSDVTRTGMREISVSAHAFCVTPLSALFSIAYYTCCASATFLCRLLLSWLIIKLFSWVYRSSIFSTLIIIKARGPAKHELLRIVILYISLDLSLWFFPPTYILVNKIEPLHAYGQTWG